MTYLDRLPAALQHHLTGARRGEDPLPFELREAIAREAFTLGTATRGPVLRFVVVYLCFIAGRNDRPSPPALTVAERDFIARKLDEAGARIAAKRRRLEAEAAGRRPPLVPNPDGYTDPANVA